MGKSSNIPGEVIVPVIRIKILKSSVVFAHFVYLSVMDTFEIYMTQSQTFRYQT